MNFFFLQYQNIFVCVFFFKSHKQLNQDQRTFYVRYRHYCLFFLYIFFISKDLKKKDTFKSVASPLQKK